MVAVRTVFNDRVIEMPDDEAAVLRAQGLLREDTPKPAAPTSGPAATAPAASKKGS